MAVYQVAPAQSSADTFHLCRDSVRAAKRRRAGSSAELPLLLRNCRILDVTAGACSHQVHQVLLQGGSISAVDPACLPETAVVIDCGGMVLMPGLCDAHVHCTAVTANLPGLLSLPESLVTAKAVDILEGMLSRGFTTIRDAGGADWGLAQAVEEGAVLGPRILFTGHALSQTGGHGDMRGKGEEVCACGAALRGIGRVADGVGECRRAARDELRKGAHCIKVMASGGVASPTDRLENTQFSLEELRAIVEEAEAAGTYVCAHAYMPSAIKRAIQCGVRSIEHGNWLDEECAQLMVTRGVFLVPTVVTYDALREEGVGAGMSADLVAKVGRAVEEGLAAVRLASAAGVQMCYGSDLLGALHRHQSREFLLRTRAGQTPGQLLAAATVNCAALFNMQGQLGGVAPGHVADLLLVDGDPTQDITLLTQHSRIRLVIKEGLVAKVPSADLMNVNQDLLQASGSG